MNINLVFDEILQELAILKENIKSNSELSDFLYGFQGYCSGCLSLNDSLSKRNFIQLLNSHFLETEDHNKLKRFFIKPKTKEADYLFLSTPTVVDVTFRSIGVDRIPEVTKKLFKDQRLEIIDYVDFEIFEYPFLTSAFDRSKQLAELGDAIDPIEYSVVRSIITEERLHLEKEKIHFKFIKCNNGHATLFVPTYIGVGTNIPLGITISGESGKTRWKKISLENDVPFKESYVLKTNKHKSVREVLRQRRYGLLDFCIIDSTLNMKESTVIVYGLKKDNANTSERILEGFYKYKITTDKNGNIIFKRPVGEVSISLDYEKINAATYINGFSSNKNLIAKFHGISEEIDTEYNTYFDIQFNPYNILKTHGKSIIHTVLADKMNSTHTSGEAQELINAIIENNTHVIAEDIMRPGISSERLVFANLILGLMLKTDKFLEILESI